jgi:hypothetical protein
MECTMRPYQQRSRVSNSEPLLEDHRVNLPIFSRGGSRTKMAMSVISLRQHDFGLARS